MARRFTGAWWVGILVLAVLGWHGAFPGGCFAADPLPTEVEEDLPDMNFIKAQAEAGRAKYQTTLRATEPVFQSVPPVLRPPSYPR
jgi:hypothetical protein